MDDKKSFYYDFVNLVLKSSSVIHMAEGYKYITKIGNSAQSTVLNILQTTGSRSGEWLMRFDNPHPGTNYPHLNMRHKFTGIKDPHLRLPPGTLTVAKYTAHVSKILNVLRNLTYVQDIYRLCAGYYKDNSIGKRTYYNTFNCLTAIVFEWTGGLLGAAIGTGLGAILLPGVGSLCGAILCGPAGVFYGSRLANSLTEKQRMQQLTASVRMYASKWCI